MDKNIEIDFTRQLSLFVGSLKTWIFPLETWAPAPVVWVKGLAARSRSQSQVWVPEIMI